MRKTVKNNHQRKGRKARLRRSPCSVPLPHRQCAVGNIPSPPRIGALVLRLLLPTMLGYLNAAAAAARCCGGGGGGGNRWWRLRHPWNRLIAAAFGGGGRFRLNRFMLRATFGPPLKHGHPECAIISTRVRDTFGFGFRVRVRVEGAPTL